MARKRSTKSEEQDEFAVDEPSEVEEGANDSSSQNETLGRQKKRRTSTRTRTIKKPYRGGGEDSELDDEEDEEEDDELDSEEEKPKKKGRPSTGSGRGRGRPSTAKGKPPAKRPKKEETEEESEENEDSEEEDDGEESDEGDAADTPEEFRSGCFVVQKTDIDNGEEDYPVWKVDGKSLLQKFDRFKHKGELLFKGTTIYAGWSKAVIDTYYPIKIDHKKLAGLEMAVRFDPSQIKKRETGNETTTNTTVEPSEVKSEPDETIDDGSSAEE